MSSARRRTSYLAAFAFAALALVGCSEPEDEVSTAKGGGRTPAVPSGAAVAVPKQNPAANLDPDTQAKCDSVWAFQLFSYSANVLPNRNDNEVGRLKAGLDEHETAISTKVPTLATPAKDLGAHARKVLEQPVPTAGATLPENLAGANSALLAFLSDTCKMTN